MLKEPEWAATLAGVLRAKLEEQVPREFAASEPRETVLRPKTLKGS